MLDESSRRVDAPQDPRMWRGVRIVILVADASVVVARDQPVGERNGSGTARPAIAVAHAGKVVIITMKGSIARQCDRIWIEGLFADFSRTIPFFVDAAGQRISLVIQSRRGWCRRGVGTGQVGAVGRRNDGTRLDGVLELVAHADLEIGSFIAGVVGRIGGRDLRPDDPDMQFVHDTPGGFVFYFYRKMSGD